MVYTNAPRMSSGSTWTMALSASCQQTGMCDCMRYTILYTDSPEAVPTVTVRATMLGAHVTVRAAMAAMLGPHVVCTMLVPHGSPHSLSE